MKKWAIVILVLILCAPALCHADDTEIYGTVTSTSVDPNILIIFDSSGSMGTDVVPSTPYNPIKDYSSSGPYNKSAVYVRERIDGQFEWTEFAPDVSLITCFDIQRDLVTLGYASGKIYGSRWDYDCANRGQPKTLRLGNYLNYTVMIDTNTRSRIDIAKDVILDLIDRTDGVNFGAMRFNNTAGDAMGGRIIAPCGTDKTTVKNRISEITAGGYTPLAETLAEAGLYFAGMESWFNSGVTYTSPMLQRCQKNYIIIMTDGEPTQDQDSKLTSANYINGDVIGDYDHDGADPGTYSLEGSDYLDDVAKYLYENDCNPTLGDGTSFDKQNIVTYTIGFSIDHDLLMQTASNGGGQYYTASNYSELSEAFYHIMSSIREENAVFVAPVVPISRMNRTYAGDRIYLGFFKPQVNGSWIGNIKRYALDSDGTLYDANGMVATTPEGLIKNNALSFWTTLGNDGPDVSAGGAAEVLQRLIENSGTRSIYTYTGGAETLLTDASNAFTTANTALTNTALDVADDTERQDVIDMVHDGWFGDVIHSEPVVVYYPDPDGNSATDDEKTMIYTGANDGMLHCIDDDDGSEAWSFIPPSQLNRLKLLGDADHDYFIDGSPVVYTNANQMIMIVGERRGGHTYTALDISSPTAPKWLYSIAPDILDLDGDPATPYEALGQSWGKPERATIVTGSAVTWTGCDLSIDTTAEDVFLIPGGYDNDNQDREDPASSDSVGRALFAVGVSSGSVVSNFNFNKIANDSLGMTHSFVDLTALDHDGDGIHSRIYAGDLGGGVFAFKDDEVQSLDNGGTCTAIVQSVVDGSWSAKKLFNASADGVQRKIMYAPDAVAEEGGEMIFFGTGDRSDPGETEVANRIYAVKNDWASTATLTEADLVNVTSDLIQLGTADQKAGVQTALDGADGWYIELENLGEKVVASPRVYGGVVYFTTYTPASGSEGTTDADDPCAVSTARGTARLYALNYKNGGSVLDLSSDPETDPDGGAVLGKKDRSVAIGTAIPSAPVIAVLAGGARIFIGVEGGIVSLPTIATQDMYTYYWTQMF